MNINLVCLFDNFKNGIRFDYVYIVIRNYFILVCDMVEKEIVGMVIFIICKKVVVIVY